MEMWTFSSSELYESKSILFHLEAMSSAIKMTKKISFFVRDHHWRINTAIIIGLIMSTGGIIRRKKPQSIKHSQIQKTFKTQET